MSFCVGVCECVGVDRMHCCVFSLGTQCINTINDPHSCTHSSTTLTSPQTDLKKKLWPDDLSFSSPAIFLQGQDLLRSLWRNRDTGLVIPLAFWSVYYSHLFLDPHVKQPSGRDDGNNKTSRETKEFRSAVCPFS